MDNEVHGSAFVSSPRRAMPRRSLALAFAPALAMLAVPTVSAAQQPPADSASAIYESMEWRNIGPNRGGRSLGVAGSASRPLVYYFGATGGGLWKTTDGGITWDPVTDGQITSSSIGAVAVCEANPDVVYIGGGETQLRGSITQGDGVYKSTDAGETWTHLGLEETQAIARVRIDSNDCDRVFVAALGHPYAAPTEDGLRFHPERGVYRSLDGGQSWENVLHVSDQAGAADLIIDPTNPDVIYASTWQVYRQSWKMWGGGPESGLHKSVDGGDTWTELTANPGMPEPPIGKIGVTVSPANPDRVWAIVEANDGGVFRSDDGGETWVQTNDERKLRQRAFYYSRIYADPEDPDVVYALNTGFYKSVDGGETFPDSLRSRPPHGDQHDLWIDPTNPLRMINGNDGGGNVSVNGGETWTEQDYTTTQLYHVTTTSDFPYHVCGAQQDNSTLCMPSDGWGFRQARGPNHGWYYAVGGGESGYITQSPTDPDVFYAGSQGALLTRYNRSNGQNRDIQVYPRFFSGEPASALPERWQWTFPIVFSPVDPNIMYTVSQHVWKTTDDGQSWQRISPDLTLADPETLGPTGGLITMDMNGPEIYATVFALAPSHHDVNTIWAGSDDGLVHITRDGGQTWADITPSDMPKYTRVSIIDASRHDPGTAYVAGNRYQIDDRAPYVWKTDDYGETWTKIVDGVAPGHFARAVREDPVRPGLLYLGTEHGVYASWDAGESWRSLQLNLPDTPVRDLVVEDHDLVLGTHGRGFWILDDIGPLRQLTTDVADASVHLFEPHGAVRREQPAVFSYYLKEPVDEVTIEVLDAGGQTVHTYVGTPEDSASAEQEEQVDEDDEPEPTPSTEAGLHRFEWDLRHPGATAFDEMIIWSADPEEGPWAVPGAYEVRLTAAGSTQSHPFELHMDPRLQGVTVADLQEQVDLAVRVRDRTSEANEAVIRIREVREAVNGRLEEMDAADDDELADAAGALLDELAAIEQDLYQVQNRSNQDPLNFSIKVNNRLASLRRSIEAGDARPTDAAHRVFEELSAELDGHLARLQAALESELADRLGLDSVAELDDEGPAAGNGVLNRR